MERPVLIDQLLSDQTISCNHSEYDGRWFIAKPHRLLVIKERFYHAWLVLIGKAQAHQFYEDRN